MTALIAPVALAACDGDDRVVLGDQSPRPYHFGAPVAIAALASELQNDNPTLTADLHEIFFTSERDYPGTTHVWSATRAAADLAFGTPQLVTAVMSGYETSPAISADGLTLWYASDRSGGLGALDIWVTTRANRSAPWASPVNLVTLNSTAKDLPRPLGQHDHVMPMSSERDTPGLYQIYMAAGAASGDALSAPTRIAELSSADLNTVDGFLTDDGTTLFFTQGLPGGTSDLFVAWRRSTSAPFTVYVPLDDINLPTYDERDPWLTPDGTQLYFTSNRSGVPQIYVAPVSRDPP